jgi:hypothetical protein
MLYDLVSLLVALSVDDSYIEFNVAGRTGVVKVNNGPVYNFAADKSWVGNRAAADEICALPVTHPVKLFGFLV